MHLLELKNLTKSFDGTPVLKGISLAVEKGEFVTLLGPSGCGKTTTLRIVAGLEAPDGGRVLLNGADVTETPPNKRAVNTVFQNYALFPHMNVEKNIAYGLRIRGVARLEIKRQVEEALELVQLPDYGRRMPAQLSGGQRQRVAIARAVVCKPDVLLLDEPLGALDLQLRRQMQVELKALQQRLGIAFVYITHDQEEALNMSDRIAVMREGQFVQIGSPEEIYERPNSRFTAQFIGQGAVFEGRVGASDDKRLLVLGDYGTLAVAPDSRYAPGTPVAVGVHAERIRYGLEPAPDFDMPADIASHRYAGALLKTELRLKNGTLLTANSQGAISSLPPVGARVYVHWPLGAAALIAGEAAS